MQRGRETKSILQDKSSLKAMHSEKESEIEEAD